MPGTVTVTENASVYWNYQVWPLTKGQQISGGLADHLLATGGPVEENSAAPAEDADGDGVPDGTVAQVLDWVGDERERAQAAWDAEAAKGDAARATLIGPLEKLLSAE